MTTFIITRLIGPRKAHGRNTAPDHGPSNHTHRRDGMTLIEVMMASVVLFMALVALITGFTAARRSAFMAANGMTAVHTARLALETLNNYSYDDANLSYGRHSIAGLGISNLYWVTTNTVYPSTKDVQVTVYWAIPGRTNMTSLSYYSSLTKCLHP
jgi:Tfp pilus assembly protein PilV